MQCPSCQQAFNKEKTVLSTKPSLLPWQSTQLICPYCSAHLKYDKKTCITAITFAISWIGVVIASLLYQRYEIALFACPSMILFIGWIARRARVVADN
jgi:hypothetical protein